MKKIRCAIYTRKSSEEGLEQDFNSLDAQREACAAYVLSQASEGWTLLPQHYDDGGISGGTLERPALQRLLADVASGAIDIIVVYKVDRLTRSLLDFSKLVEAFDTAGVSFVSVTQSFNTTTSMGRLTLNMLLSFAQFEREVTAERIRDKLAASKAKGMWMGGIPPLGYKPNGRSLAIVEEHAALVREIYEHYLNLGSVRLIEEHLQGKGIRTPARTTSTGKTYGNCPFTRGQLYSMLKNPIYVGDIPHGGKVYKGQHPAIIERNSWDRVQATLAAHRHDHAKRARAQHPSLLAGLMVDDDGQRMLATHAAKGRIRYRYYVSEPLHHNRPGAEGLRLPAGEIEAAVLQQVARLFDDPLALARRISHEVSPDSLQRFSTRCRDLAAQLRDRGAGPLPQLISEVRASRGKLEIEIAVSHVLELLGAPMPDRRQARLALTVPFNLTRTGRAVRLIQGDGARASSASDPALVKLLAQARRWWSMLNDGALDIKSLAAREKVSASYVTRVVRLAFLAPDIVEAVLAGCQRADLDAADLRLQRDVPARWSEQLLRYLPAK